METAECYFCFGSFLEPSGYEDVNRHPPPGRKYWSGGQSYEGRMVPDFRCYDRYAWDHRYIIIIYKKGSDASLIYIYAWDIPMCGHPAFVFFRKVIFRY